MDTSKLLFSLIRSELMGNEIALEVKNCINMDSLAELYSLSAKHDLAHFLGNNMVKMPFIIVVSDKSEIHCFRRVMYVGL